MRIFGINSTVYAEKKNINLYNTSAHASENISELLKLHSKLNSSYKGSKSLKNNL